DKRIELPQAFFMRVAMGLSLNEVEREAKAIEFYNILSSFDFMSSTPTLFNSGTTRPQLSSCYLTTVDDDLDGIYEAIKENALLSKYAGGLGNDWSSVRALGAHIKGTNGKSQGVVPFLKVVNDTAVAVNQGGKRKGAVCAYLETWHMDIEEFLELRKNTGDDRRRTHDMNSANWIPDLFMKRVMNNENWTLFSPSDVPDLHDKFGKQFEQAYTQYEAEAAAGKIKLFKTISAVQLWRKMLSMLFETGHPWMTFKDPCNIRSPQQHIGVVHSSNLCTEITLNTSDSEIAVCNLGSVNLVAHLKDGQLDMEKLKRTVTVAMRMLDNVIDINYYAVGKARNSNLKHRPVGMGIMGFQDCLHEMKIPYASDEAVEFADRAMEAVCFNAYWASTELAEERGKYSTFDNSLWARGILPFDSIELLREERGGNLEVDLSKTLDWEQLRERVTTVGMRNSNCVAIAPTATIANIIGVSASIEPTYQNLYVKSNLSGEFTIANRYLVDDLKRMKLWDDVMISDLKYFDGSLSKIDRIPPELRKLYATAFEMDANWLVECASRRQKWIDQAQSLNIYLAGASGKKLDEIYKLAWVRGLKTTYYLRTMGATSAEKSTVQSGQLNAVSAEVSQVEPKFCAIDDPECEACQ
ncbi:MAG: ribonucleoside-diphosphate reductase subunit alpha, partial [Betaproteobacteria bacterium]